MSVCALLSVLVCIENINVHLYNGKVSTGQEFMKVILQLPVSI